MESPLQPAVPSQRVLVVSEDAELRETLALAVQRGGGLPVRVAGLGAIDGPQVAHRLVVFAWDGNLPALRALISKLRESAQIIAVTPPRPLGDQVTLMHDPHICHVITNDTRTPFLLQVTIAKFVSGDLFGVEKYLPPGTPVSLTRLRDYQGREKAITEVLEYAEKVGVRNRIRDKIGTVCVELLMNALYDAPVDDRGQRVFEHVEAKDRIEQLTPRPVSIRYAAVDNMFAVSVRDRFGSLDKATILRYIEKCLRSPNQIDRKTYGAGLGIYLIANAATQYVVNIAPGMATEVVCTFDCGTLTPLRALSVFVYPGSANPAGSPSQMSGSHQKTGKG